MVWTYSDLLKLPCRSKFQLPDFIKCARGSFPDTEEAVFNFQEPDGLKNQIIFNAEDNLLDADGSRRWDRFNLPCEGDSGMGHWMYKSEKAVLVGIVADGSDLCGKMSHVLSTLDDEVLNFIKQRSNFL